MKYVNNSQTYEHTTMYTRVYAISLNSKMTVLCYLIKHKQNILHLE